MKIVNYFLLILTLILPLGCQSYNDSVSPADSSNTVALDSPKIHREVGADILDVENVTIIKTIDGTVGGKIDLDTLLVNSFGNLVRVQANLKFDPSSFNGSREISLVANIDHPSIQFFPEMTFSKEAKLNLVYTGLNLTTLGFFQNSVIDFLFIDNNGVTEPILNDFCIINWQQQSLRVANAKLHHFSRYIFVRKSL